MVNKRRKSKITISEVAERADVSKTTVSFYLNGKYDKMSAETQSRIKKVIEEVGYSPSTVARSLKLKRTNLLGVIVADISNPFSSYIVKGVDDIARKNNYQIIVGSTNFDPKLEKVYLDKMFDVRVDGFIIQPTMKSKNIIQSLVDDGHNIVLLDSIFKEFKGICVKTNNYEVTTQTIEELIGKGYEDFIFISDDIELLGPRMERANSFCDTLQKYGQSYSVETFPSSFDDEKVYVDVYNKLSKRIDFSKKTILFACNGRILEKIFKLAKEKRWDIPESIGIIGFDDWGWQELTYPTVSAIEQPTYEEGKIAGELLIDKIEGKIKENYIKVLECKVNWRDSTNI
ncbi:LacI family transcriptional regulator [Clostridium novyi A str. 4552]|uniref:LacI family transcriptional regulator n=1 Tax=Clostridium novyi A str. 4552 TaxID=1444289 RepID=A0A0A0I7K3_CLONO|nr:LacI family DNA-binding transcriptional regulator [Clostridium novyi]KGM97429.1 LacI family transcriptional regulator [Clostridium novyi A str. 4552]